MKSLLIVGIDNEFVHNFAEILAKVMKFEFVDVDLEFEKVLINSFDSPIFEADEILIHKERMLLGGLTKRENIVLCVKDNTFLSNENYSVCSNSLVITIEKQNLNKIENNIQNLLKQHSTFCVLQSELTIEKMINLLR